MHDFLRHTKKLLVHLCLLLVTHPMLAQQDSQTVQAPLKKGSPKLNVLFIAVDDLRTQLGCYGDSVAITPNIDRLAQNGTVFTRAYAQQAVCNPSRASLMTGLRPNTTKVWDLQAHFRDELPDVITLPQYFKQHGYHAQSVGKIYHDPAAAQDAESWSAPETMAVTKFEGKYALEANRQVGPPKAAASESADVPDDAYIDGQVSEAAIEILEKIKDRPFFLAVGFRRPHLPFSAPEKYWDMYERESVPLPENTEKPLNVPDVALHNWVELRGYTDIRKSGALDEDKVRELIHGYYASTSYTDAQVGKLLAALDRLGLTNNTIVVLWSDHGYHLGEKGLWCKTTNFELDTRVPLIFSVPGGGKGQTTTALAELVDLYPTLADLAGFDIPGQLEGVSLKPVLEDPERAVKAAAYSQFTRPFNTKKEPQIMGYSVRTDRFRYTEWTNIQTGEIEARELYDHDADPSETKNVAGDKKHLKDIKKLSKLIKKEFLK